MDRYFVPRNRMDDTVREVEGELVLIVSSV